LRVLVLEDISADAELMIHELRQSGFDPDWERVETGEQYLAHLRPDLDVILADYTLPRFDAVEALRLLRKRKLDVPFIVVTGTIEEEAAVACLRQGADDYLIKDRLARLGPAVEQALEAQRLRGERRAAEREARVSARQWQATFDAISAPVFLLDAGGRIARCNEAAEEFAGERFSDGMASIPLVGRSCCEIVHGASSPIDGCPYQRALESQRREAQIWQRGDRWFRAIVDPMLDGEGYLIGFVYVLEEITERKRTEQALRRRNRELSLLNQAGRTLNSSLELEEVLGAVLEEVRGLLDVVGCSAWLQDAETDDLVCRQVTGPRSDVARGWRLEPGAGIVGWVVDRGESLIVPDAERDERHFKGVDEETGLPIRSILSVPLQVKGSVIGALQAVDTEAGRFDSRDRRLLEALAASAAIAIQNARLYEQAETEIAHRERAEAALRASEERFGEVVRRSPIGIAIVDSDGQLVDCNEAIANLLGFPREELLKLSFEDFTHPEDLEAEWPLIDELWSGKRDEYRMTKRYIHEDGHTVWVDVAASLVRDEAGGPRLGFAFVQDITKRRRTEEALRESESRFRALVEPSSDHIFMLDREGVYLFSNGRVEHFGLEDRESLVGCHLCDVYPPEVAEFYQQKLEQVLATGEAMSFEHPMPEPDAARYHIDTLYPIRRTGDIWAVGGICRDITERKRAEEELKRSERELRLTLDATTDGVWKWNFKTDELFFSPRYYKMLGYEPGEFPATFKGWVDLIHPNDRDAALSAAQTYLATKPDFYHNEFRLRTKFGDYRWIRATARVVERDDDGRAVRMIGNHEDITERRRAETALKRHVTELRLLNEVGQQIVGELNLDAVLENATRLVQETFGYYQVVVLTVDQEQGDLVVRAKRGGFARLIPDGYRQGLDEGIIGWVASQGEAVLVDDVENDPRYLNRYPDQIRTRSELSVPIRLGGDVVGVLDVQSEYRDAFGRNDLLVIETVADQIAVAMRNARLYEAEREAREQLRQLTGYLQEAREDERTRIAREIHDEFGQMMTALKMDLSWLSKRLPDDRPQLVQKADTMSDVIDRSFKVMRRISSELRPGMLDDLGLAAAVEWQAETFCERSDIVCRLHLDEAAERLNRELSTILFRIFQEALTNVARHAEATEVQIDLQIGPNEVVLIVADDGRGIAPDELSGSASLGLMGMRERARALDGELTVKGVPGHGTTVTASIPYHE
jgi:PAS domain S-box-containing protein